MKIVLQPGDELVVSFEDTDEEFRIHFDSETHPNSVTIEETVGYPDEKGREGILYSWALNQEHLTSNKE